MIPDYLVFVINPILVGAFRCKAPNILDILQKLICKTKCDRR
ncbi:hypothetical protein H1P_2400009 [Hyella patelloides LEGE 07179]|uniref:Uncharacterized protein n=1 Tax=Hyella patelloides LEGE 07179 TaxID=945734 RepID=A0A563VRV1_9CYAN|nr:hypothetical protein H1P_2400009 [Hyella patelloides LEGE 07179]